MSCPLQHLGTAPPGSNNVPIFILLSPFPFDSPLVSLSDDDLVAVKSAADLTSSMTSWLSLSADKSNSLSKAEASYSSLDLCRNKLDEPPRCDRLESMFPDGNLYLPGRTA